MSAWRGHAASGAAVLALVIAGAGGCAAGDDATGSPSFRAGDLTIDHVVAPAPVGDAVAALYFRVASAGAADTLDSIATPAARSATLHEQMLHDGGMVMHAAPPLAVPAGGSAELAPGGTHVMLEGLTRSIAAGDSIPVTLTFRRAGALRVVARVVSYAQLEGALAPLADSMRSGAKR
jgi:copper(I)-binding protein